MELYVLPDQGDGHFALSFFAQRKELLPVLELGLLCWCHSRLLEHDLIQVLVAEGEGHLIDRGDVHTLHDGLGRDIAEESHLAQDVTAQGVLGT